MGIFEANIRGHTGDEDTLTSSVFGVLEVVDSSKFLTPILEIWGGWPLDSDRSTDFTFEYWKSAGKRIPDVIIRNNAALIFIECKLGSPADTRQLVEEYKDGVSTGENFRLVLVTADNNKPSEIDAASTKLKAQGFQDPRLQWISWQQIYAVLKQNIESDNHVEKRLVQAVLLLLKSKGLSMFEQFQQNQISRVTELWPDMVSFIEECSALFQTLSSHLKEKNIVCEDSIRTGNITRLLQHPRYWVPRWLGIRAWDEKWEKDFHQCLIVLFLLNPLQLNVGYRLSIGGEYRKLWEMFSDVAKNRELALKLQERNYSVSLYGADLVPTAEIGGDDIKQGLATHVTRGVGDVVIGRVFTNDELYSTDLLSNIEECLIELRNIIRDEKLYLSTKIISTVVSEADSVNSSGMDEVSILKVNDHF